MNLVVVNVIVDWLAGWMLEGPVHCWGGWTEDDYIFAIIGHLDADPQYTLVCHSVTRTLHKEELGGAKIRALSKFRTVATFPRTVYTMLHCVIFSGRSFSV